DAVASQGTVNAIGGGHVEHDDGHMVLHVHGKGGNVHHLEAALKGLEVREVVELLGGGVGGRVGVVYTVDAVLGHQQRFAVRLDGTESAGGVGRHVGVARARGEEDDTAFFEMPNGAPADIRFGDCGDGDGRLCADEAANLLERILEGERVHDRAEHTGV